MYSMMGDATKDLFAGIFNSPEFKEEMSKKLKKDLIRNNYYRGTKWDLMKRKIP